MTWQTGRWDRQAHRSICSVSDFRKNQDGYFKRCSDGEPRPKPRGTPKPPTSRYSIRRSPGPLTESFAFGTDTFSFVLKSVLSEVRVRVRGRAV